MTWLRLDDQWMRHPKVQAVSKDARLLWLAGALHCAAHTDGVIDKRSLRLIAAEAEVPTRRADELVDVGLWDDMGDHYAVHDWLEYQPSKADVERQRGERAEVKSAAGKKGNHARWHADAPDPDCAYCIAERSQNDRRTIAGDSQTDRPGPARPGLTTSSISTSSSSSETAHAIAAAAAVVDHPQVAECIDLATKVRERQAGDGIRNPVRWRRKVSEGIRDEHSAAFVAALDGGSDPTGAVATVLGIERMDVVRVTLSERGYL